MTIENQGQVQVDISAECDLTPIVLGFVNEEGNNQNEEESTLDLTEKPIGSFSINKKKSAEAEDLVIKKPVRPKRPTNPFMFYVKRNSKDAFKDQTFEKKAGEGLKYLSAVWQKMTEEEKAPYEELSR